MSVRVDSKIFETVEGVSEFVKRVENLIPKAFDMIDSIEGFKGLKTTDDVTWFITNRSIRTLGRCTYNKCRITGGVNGADIMINMFYFDQCENDDQLFEVIIHELCHAYTPGHGHTGKWRYLVNRLNSKYDLNIKRCADMSDNLVVMETLKAKRLDYRYMIRCVGCGNAVRRRVMSKAVTHPELYRCTLCGDVFERVE